MKVCEEFVRGRIMIKSDVVVRAESLRFLEISVKAFEVISALTRHVVYLRLFARGQAKTTRPVRARKCVRVFEQV